jgi:hypothetical protein
MKLTLTFILFFSLLKAFGQYAPAVGQPGSTAIYKDSSIFVNWASQTNVTRGLQQINDASYGYASVGDNTSATGKAGLNGVVSLGDGGNAIVRFHKPIRNGSGYDFAVFENALNDQFLELAFVEVSSDGINFFRFPASSLTAESPQAGSFASTLATNINNLAGKYRADYGTPFDLQELSTIAGLNIDSIVAVKIIDVVGCIQEAYTTYDSQGRKVNDPWPTPYPSSGFDLDAIGVIHELSVSGINDLSRYKASFYPNPLSSGEKLTFPINSEIIIKDLHGVTTYHGSAEDFNNNLAKGIYFIIQVDKRAIEKLIVR